MQKGARGNATQGIAADFRAAFRGLRRHSAFTVVALAVIALPIAAVIAIFAIFNGLYLDALPYPAPERLAAIRQSMPAMGAPDIGVSHANLHAWQTRNRTFESISLYQEDGASLAGDGDTVRLLGASVSWDMGKTLGIKPILGRDLHASDDRPGAPCAMLMGYDLWRTTFRGASTLIGRQLQLDRTACTVVGILPRSAIFPRRSEFWVPLYMGEDNPVMVWDGVGRLKPGITPEQARLDLVAIDRAVALENNIPERQRTVPLVAPLRDRFLGRYRLVVGLLFAAAAFVLLVACANLAGLLLARAMGRAREFAIRTAIGAGRFQLARQAFVEAFVLIGVAGVFGVGLAWSALRALVAAAPEVLPAWVRFNLDARVVLAAVAAVAIVTMLTALAPALSAASTDVRPALAAASPNTSLSRGRLRLMGFAIAGEVALATILVTSGELVLNDARRVLQTDPDSAPRILLLSA